METPYSGRAIITDNFDKMEIVIPGKKSYFILLFFSVWLVGWFFGETSVTSTIGNGSGPDLFLMVWLAGWTIGGIFVVSTILFMLLGKEIIEAGQGTISVRNQALFFLSPKVYDLNEVKHIRAVEEFSMYNGFQFGRRQRGVFSNFNSGTVKFDYGLKTVKFGNDLDEAEARHIIERLKSKRILTGEEFLKGVDKVKQIDIANPGSNIEELNDAQKVMLKMSDDDIEHGRLISQDEINKADLEWLEGLDFNAPAISK